MLLEGHAEEGRIWNFTPPRKLSDLQKTDHDTCTASPVMGSTQMFLYSFKCLFVFSRATAKSDCDLSSLSCVFLCVEWGHHL